MRDVNHRNMTIKSIIIISWALSLSAAYVLGIYTVYRHELHSGISEAQYYQQSLQYLEDIRNSNDIIMEATVDLYSDF